MNDVARRLGQVRARLQAAERACGRPPGSVHVLAVSKQHSGAAIDAAIAAGQHAFGENYLQEALEKMAALAGREAQWHFIGPVQANKTKSIATNFDWLHSLDRLKVAQRLSAQRPADRPPLQVCLQVNISGEAEKSGVAPNALPELAARVAELPNLTLRGLMTIPAPARERAEQRRPLRELRRLLESLQADGLALDTLSMGMSADLEAAVAEGATIVRMGTAVFGPRPGQSRTEGITDE